MTEAYLLLLDVFKNEDIYVDHNKKGFYITIEEEKIGVPLSKIKEFITTFVDNKNIKDGK